jgi:hypothetical protein
MFMSGGMLKGEAEPAMSRRLAGATVGLVCSTKRRPKMGKEYAPHAAKSSEDLANSRDTHTVLERATLSDFHLQCFSA